jgi:multidrug efflux pump
VKHVNSITGTAMNLGARGPNFGQLWIILDSYHERAEGGRSATAIMADLKKRLSAGVPEALTSVSMPAAVSGVGRTGGFKIMIEDRGSLGIEALQKHTDELILAAKERGAAPELGDLSTIFKTDSPQLFVDVNRDACLTQGVSMNELFGTMQAYLGSRYVNDFNRFGRTWRVIVQAEGEFRDQVEDFKRLRVRNNQGQMVPLGSTATTCTRRRR